MDMECNVNNFKFSETEHTTGGTIISCLYAKSETASHRRFHSRFISSTLAGQCSLMSFAVGQ
jgi:hypothetical protein